MLTSTFLHLKGVGAKTEKSLWKKGILTWDKYPFDSGQYALSKELAPPSPLQKTIDAYQAGDMSFFAKHLPLNSLYRVALEFPDDTLFLDIETTGLSIFYDIVTLVGWSVGNEFDVYINGQDDEKLRKALKSAKSIVTFNGTRFDLKFLQKHFSDLDIPPVHIDLMFLAKRVGLSGGQKKIEEIIGYRRTKEVKGMLGEAAPILWHQYRRGDLGALKRLITYNHEDVEGMKSILDYCIKMLFKIDSVPVKIRSKFKFSQSKAMLKWERESNGDGISIQEYSGSTKPLIEYKDLNNLFPLDNFIVAGIDLVSSEKKESGCCILKGNVAHTCRLKTDEDIIQWAIDSKANLISIDSPLSIPEGRTSFFDDDPHRALGIMRTCERILKRRGINVYPSLIQSMQKLTRRGMTLAEKFRNRGIPVIESYPGAAQDIISIPRKQAGLYYLAQGLKEFGLTGNFVDTQVSHDELDAITSAVVGLFFWTGMFEPLGNPLEEYLIIPDLNGDSNAWLNRKVIGICESLESSSDIEDRLGRLNFDILNFQKVETLAKEREDLYERADSLANEIGVPIDLQRKWLGKELVSRYQTSNRLFLHGLTKTGDRSMMTEIFGPAFNIFNFDNISDLLTKFSRQFSRNLLMK